MNVLKDSSKCIVKDEDESETEYENDSDHEVKTPISIFTKKKQLIRFDSKHLKNYKEMVNDITDSSSETSPVKPMKRFEKSKQQSSVIFGVHRQILKNKRLGFLETDKNNTQNLADDIVKVEENELVNVLNVRLEELLEMKRKERLSSQTSDSSVSEQFNKSLKENNSDVAEQSPSKLNTRLKKLLEAKKLAPDGTVKIIRIRERDITVKDEPQPINVETFKQRTCAVTETEVIYDNKNTPSKSLIDDFNMKCSMRGNDSKENFTPKISTLSKKLMIFRKSSLYLDKT
ncbi:hypothetical protein O0L34_g12243 [Tuta absoluta]|nr:hypothetical protein O0L34_g12243 [Tuta absoluta]